MSRRWLSLLFSSIVVDPFKALGEYDPVHHIEHCRIYGNIDDYAYYFIDLLVGEPVQRVSVIVDTGSGITGFPCRSCPHCGNHIDPNFDFQQSTTAQWLDCGNTCRSSCTSGHCAYQQGYTEGSSINGYYFRDWVRLGDALQKNPPVMAEMGCHQEENKLFYTQKANGIMGIRPPKPGSATILEQLFADKEHVDTQVFSLCLAENGGSMVAGGFDPSYNTGEMKYFPMDTASSYYGVPLRRMVINGVEVTGLRTAIVDSGTTYTYMGSGPYNALKNGIEAFCASNSNCGATPSGQCWTASNGLGGFPSVEVWFNDVQTTWTAPAYLYRRSGSDTWCYSFQDDGSGATTVLGASWMMHQQVAFDLRDFRIGVAQANCPEYTQRPVWVANPDLTVPTASGLGLTSREASPGLNVANMSSSEVDPNKVFGRGPSPANLLSAKDIRERMIWAGLGIASALCTTIALFTVVLVAWRNSLAASTKEERPRSSGPRTVMGASKDVEDQGDSDEEEDLLAVDKAR